MALDIYNSSKVVVSSGTESNPLRTFHDGKSGSAEVELVYVRNDSTAFYYQNVQVLAIDSSGYDDTVGEYGTGFSVKFAYGAVEPLPHEWNLVEAGAAAVIPTDIGTSSSADTTTYYPVWVRINVPGNTRVQNKTDISLRLQYIKRPIV